MLMPKLLEIIRIHRRRQQTQFSKPRLSKLAHPEAAPIPKVRKTYT
jgi:hypothetical protein